VGIPYFDRGSGGSLDSTTRVQNRRIALKHIEHANISLEMNDAPSCETILCFDFSPCWELSSSSETSCSNRSLEDSIVQNNNGIRETTT
jgi:hypothetical protein